jgi:hypothetical protein
MTTAIEIKSGVELDRAVAEAIGRGTGIFRPSTDLNAAFGAGERAAVLLKGVHVEQTLDAWWCSLDGEHGTIADTPALAICGAILKLKETAT